MLLKIIQTVMAVSKCMQNLKGRIKYYGDLRKKKDLANRLMVKWRFRNLKYGS